MKRSLAAFLVVLVACAVPLTAQQEAEDFKDAFARLPAKYQEWVRGVLGLITEQELAYFLSLTQDYRRDAFMEAFWEPRDPEPRTPENELFERWEAYRRQSGGSVPAGDPRFLLYLLNGPPGGWSLPNGQGVSRCYSASKELEIWFYGGSERTDKDVVVIFQRLSKNAPYRVYLPGDDVRPIPRQGGLPTQNIQMLCAEDLFRYANAEIRRLVGYDALLKSLMTPPKPPPEWLANFSARGADLPEGAETFDVGVEVTFPARKQSRTAVQVVLVAGRDDVPGQPFQTKDGSEQVFHNFRLVGEVLRDGALFESFNYRFEGPTPPDATAVPVGFTRYLRPGPVTLRLLLEDVYGQRYALVEREVEVPSPEGLEPVAAPERIAADGPSLRLDAPSGVLAGNVRFRAVTRGEIDKVAFFLDGERKMAKRSPPYSVILDLGEAASPHRVRVVAYVGDKEVATDQVWINQGAQRFLVHLVEPREDGLYPGGVTARVEVQTPSGEPVDRLEIEVNGAVQATLTEEPYAAPLRLPPSGPAVVRAVAYLGDGSWTEDVVVVNGSLGEVVEVRLVEVPVVVTDAAGELVAGLPRERFRLFEDGEERPIERFSETNTAPLRSALLVDRSASMAPHLGDVRTAAAAFAEAALQDAEDRVALFSFAGQMLVEAPFAASASDLARPLAGMVAEGSTALYDSVAQALNQLADSEQQPALILFSDGQDESSRLTFDEVLATARRSGVTIHAVGLVEAFPDEDARRPLRELAAETGGRAVFLDGMTGLDDAFAEILAELRTRYVLAYTPPSDGKAFRTLRVEVEGDGLRTRARRGYSP